MPKSNLTLRTGGRHARLAVLAAAATGLFATSLVAAHADTTDVLLEQLKAKGILTKGEYHKLKARHEAEKASTYRGAPGGVVVKGPAAEYVTVCPKHICMRVGQVDVTLSGDLVFGGAETFKTYGNLPGNAPATVLGGLAAAGGSRTQPYNSFQAGLLPSSLSVSLATNQMGYDLGFTISAFTGGNNVSWDGGAGANSPGNSTALGTAGIDLRQVYGTVGNAGVGTFKIGRDLGLFGSDAILNDATLLGMGSPLTTNSPRNTSLGRIGVGYIYADWIPGVVYTTPDYHGFTASIAAYTPYQSDSVFVPLTANYTGQAAPMVQGQLKWKGTLGGGGPAIVTKGEAPPSFGGVNVTLSTDGIWQHHSNDPLTGSVVAIGGANQVDSWGVDGFGKLDYAGASLVAYGYYGKGLGTTALFFDAFDPFGNPRQSYGGYVQGSYTWDKFTLGASWGVSGLKATAFDAAFDPLMVKWNESVVGFARYQLTTWMALQAEFTHTWSTNQLGGVAANDTMWLGTAWFF